MRAQAVDRMEEPPRLHCRECRHRALRLERRRQHPGGYTALLQPACGRNGSSGCQAVRLRSESRAERRSGPPEVTARGRQDQGTWRDGHARGVVRHRPDPGAWLLNGGLVGWWQLLVAVAPVETSV